MENLLLYFILGVIFIFVVIGGPMLIYSNENYEEHLAGQDETKQSYESINRSLFSLEHYDISLLHAHSFTWGGEETCKMTFNIDDFEAVYKIQFEDILTRVDVAVIINGIRRTTESVDLSFNPDKNAYIINENAFGTIVGRGFPRLKNENYYEQTIFFSFWDALNNCYNLNKDNKQAFLLDMCPDAWLGTVAANVTIEKDTVEDGCPVCSQCGKGTFNTCDLEECHDIADNCYFKPKTIGGDECQDCDSFEAKNILRTSCQIFDKKYACERCPNFFGNSKKCQWVESWSGGSCVDIAGSGCEICSEIEGDNPHPHEIRSMILEAMTVLSIDYPGYNEGGFKELIGAQMYQESGCEQYDDSQFVTCSFAGAIGLMQLMPGTAAEVLEEPTDACKPYQNVYGGVKYQIMQMENFKDCGNEQEKFALAAYNAGPDRVNQAIKNACGDDCEFCSCSYCTFNAVKAYLPQETQIYVDSIMRNTDNEEKNCYILEEVVSN